MGNNIGMGWLATAVTALIIVTVLWVGLTWWTVIAAIVIAIGLGWDLRGNWLAMRLWIAMWKVGRTKRV